MRIATLPASTTCPPVSGCNLAWMHSSAYGSPRTPSPEELDHARLHTGTHLLEFDEREHTIRLSASPVRVDLGGIGKGYAVDRVAELLGEWSIETALISGGYSSVLAMEAPPGMDGWPLTLSDPADRKKILMRPRLRAGALSGSGVEKGGHIISPRTGRPVEDRRAAWAAAPNATTGDALSTAFMIMEPDEIEQYCARHPKRWSFCRKRATGRRRIRFFTSAAGPKMCC
ncbi:MAG: FAD:protein FMN transferase [Planctomycetota bacterium]